MVAVSFRTQRRYGSCRLGLCLALALSLSGCGGGSGGGGGNDNPTIIGPSSTGLGGLWTGTLSRPGGLGPIAVRWQATHQGQTFSGPATFGYNNVTISGTISGEIAGTPAQWFADIAFNDAALPSCKAGRSAVIAGPGLTVANLATTATVLVSNPFAIAYANCQGVLGQVNVDEVTQLSLNKQ